LTILWLLVEVGVVVATVAAVAAVDLELALV
jgi:hypothetical protein